jgi:hypothetical protein
MRENIEKIFKIVEELNEEFNGDKDNILECIIPFSIKCSSWYDIVVYFYDIHIWDVDNDVREYIEDTDIKEDLKEFFIKKSHIIKDDMINRFKNYKKK